jgi:hypothetical protein
MFLKIEMDHLTQTAKRERLLGLPYKINPFCRVPAMIQEQDYGHSIFPSQPLMIL